jgi:hypothetical protein
MSRIASKLFKPETVSTDPPRTIIERGLLSLPNIKMLGSGVMIVCPFHPDNNPSCGVNLDDSIPVPLGFFNCLGCGEKGGWNKLAERLNLEKIPAYNQLQEEALKSLLENNDVDRILALLNAHTTVPSIEDELKAIIKAMRIKSYSDWSRYSDWRGFDGDFLKSLGALAVIGYTDSVKMLLPVQVHGTIRGAILAYTHKANYGPSYINSPGPWTKDFGLFPYDYVTNLCKSKRCPSVFVVEGARDSMRYLKSGFPALASLGANTFSLKKAELLCRLRTQTIVLVPDNDLGGETFTDSVLETFEDFSNSSALPVNIEVINLPKSQRKIDPFNMSDSMFKKTCVIGGYDI